MSFKRLKATVRPVLRLVRHGPDRLLHPFRRRRLLGRLRAGPAPRSALFVCHGNINRSPFAAAAFRRAMVSRGSNSVRVASAGLIGPGRPASDTARASAATRGLDLTDHVSRLVNAEEVRQTDLLVVMDAKQGRRVSRHSGRPRRGVVVLGDLDPARIVRRGIQDPYGHGDEVFERVFDRIERCVVQLADAVASSPAPDRSDR